jgi:hypothetical protein
MIGRNIHHMRFSFILILAVERWLRPFGLLSELYFKYNFI